MSVALLGTGAVALHSCHWKTAYIDDSFISYTYARNVNRGIGPQYYEGNKVEGYSNFLWMITSAATMRFFTSPLTASRVVSLFVYFIALAFACHRLLAKRYPGLVASVLLAALVAADYAWCFWISSGMETTASSCVVLLVVIALSSAGWRSGFLGAWLLSVAALLRPDAVMFLPLLLLPLLSGERWRRSWVHVLARLGMVFVLVAPLYVWRFLYYGALSPNSAMAKRAFWSVGRVGQGFGYVLQYFFADGSMRWALLPAAAYAVAVVAVGKKNDWRRERGLVVGLLFVTGAVSVSTAMLGGGGDSFRMLQPATLGLFLLAVVALQRLVAAGRAGHVVAVVLSAVLLLGGFHGLRTAGYYIRLGECEPKPQDWLLRCRPFLEFRLDVWHKAALREIALRTQDHDAIYLGDVGFLTYVSECRTIDAFGLNERRVARFYNSEGQQRDRYYEDIVSDLIRRRPVLCFLVYDTERQDYVMDLDRSLAHDSRFRAHYTWLQNLEYAGFSPKLVLHEFSRAPNRVHDAPAFLSRLEGMSRRYPLAADLYVWAVEVADTSGLTTQAAKWRQRAASAMPFWAQRQFGSRAQLR